MKRVVVFDGVCNLCNWWVDWVIRRDSKDQFKFASLQGEWAKTNVHIQDRQSLESVLLFDGKFWYRRSTAILRIAIELGGLYKYAARILLLIPVPLRDFVYNRIAKSRYRLFGQRQLCRVPTEKEKSKFLN